MEQDHAALAPAAPGPGSVVDGRYRLASIVARCGSNHATSTIYSALDERSRQRVRLRLTPHAPAPALLGLRHPAIPAVLAHGRSGRWHYAALEWFDGEPVELPTLGIPEAPRVRAWATAAMDVLDALAHVHTAAGRAHGSLCLDSLWEGRDGRLRIVDLSAPDSPLTSSNAVFASPERLRGLPCDVRSDLYSLGCVLYALITGTPPFGTEPTESRTGHLFHPLPELLPGRRSSGPVLPPAFLAVLRTALEKQPQHRFSSAGQMREAFALAIHSFDAGQVDLSQQDTAVSAVPVLAPIGGADETELTEPARHASTVRPDEITEPGESTEPTPLASILDALAPTDTLRPAVDRVGTPASELPTFVPSASLSDEIETEVRPRPELEGGAQPAAARTAVPVAVPADIAPDTMEISQRRDRSRSLLFAATLVGTGVASSLAVWLVAGVSLALFAALRPAAEESTAPGTPTRADEVAGEDAAEEPLIEEVRAEEPLADDAIGEDAARELPADEVASEAGPAPGTPPAQDAPVDFSYDNYEPRPRATFPVFVQLVARHSGAVRLTGHTDDRGPAESNYVLGLGRAWAVQRLLSLAGIEEQKIPIASKGETEPIADNATPEGRAANRRVTAEFLPPESAVAPGTPPTEER